MKMEIQKFAKSVLGHRKTKTQDLQKTQSWAPRQDKRHLTLSRCRSEGFGGTSLEEEAGFRPPTSAFQILPDLPPMRPRKFYVEGQIFDILEVGPCRNSYYQFYGWNY